MEILLSATQKFSIQKWVPLLLAATLLALPMSSTAKSICLSLSVLAILLAPTYRNEITNLLSRGWCRATLILFFLALVACLWSPASFSEKIFVMEKYSKLLYLPILVVGFREAKTRTISLHAFLVAMFITSILAVLKFNGFLSFLPINPDRVFRNHIMVGFMGAFAAYLSALFIYRQSGIKRLGYSLLFILFSYHILFVNAGRTGYVIYLLLMTLLVLQICTWKQAIAGIFLVFAAFTLIYTLNPVMKARVNLIATELDYYRQQDVNSAVGYRLKFHDYAHQLFNRHPLIGNGTASFLYYYKTEDPVPSWGPGLLEPHSQYWLLASEFGLLGIVAFLLFCGAMFKASWRLRAMRPIAFAMLLPFLMGNFSDSLLFYSGSGYFFILFMALCLGEEMDLEDSYRNKTQNRG